MKSVRFVNIPIYRNATPGCEALLKSGELKVYEIRILSSLTILPVLQHLPIYNLKSVDTFFIGRRNRTEDTIGRFQANGVHFRIESSSNSR